MKIVAFIEARQAEAIRKILEHCGLWHDPPSPPGGAPPQAARPSRSARLVPEPEPGIITYEIDADFLEHAHREKTSGGISGGNSGGDQPELPRES